MTVYLPKVSQKVCEKELTTKLRCIKLHDKASGNEANVKINFVGSTDVKVMTQPPYGPYLASPDFFLFPSV